MRSEKLRFCHQIPRDTQNKKKFKPPICDSVKNQLSTDNVGNKKLIKNREKEREGI